MRRGGRILIVFGLLLGLVTALATFSFLANQTPVEPIATRPVVIAAQNIAGRGEISTGMLTIANFPSDSAPPDAFTNLSDVIGQIALYPIYQGQVIVPRMVLTKTQTAAVRNPSIASYIIPEGKVAMAFTINDVSGVAGAIQAGDSVDMLLTLDPSILSTGGAPVGPTPRPGTTTGTDSSSLPTTQIFLQDVLVLNVGQWTSGEKNSENASILTFALDRQSALALKSAVEQGAIDLVLRRSSDRAIYDLTPVNLQYLNQKYKFNLVPSTTGR